MPNGIFLTFPPGNRVIEPVMYDPIGRYFRDAEHTPIFIKGRPKPVLANITPISYNFLVPAEVS